MLRTLATILLIFTALEGLPQDFIISHKSCKILGDIIERTSQPELFEVLEEQVKIRKFEITYVTKNHKFNKGDLILSLEREVLAGSFFSPCFIKITIKEEGAKKLFFSTGIKRSLPRHYKSDNYLCKLAVRDVLYHLPTCRITP